MYNLSNIGEINILHYIKLFLIKYSASVAKYRKKGFVYIGPIFGGKPNQCIAHLGGKLQKKQIQNKLLKYWNN